MSRFSSLETTTRAMFAVAVAAVAGSFLGHGSMIMPPSRNSIDALLPAWSNGKHAATGVIDPKVPM